MDSLGERARLREVARLAVEAGRVMLESGAETSRVEETVRRLGAACGTDVECVATPTGITVAAGSHRTVTRLARIHRRGIDLERVAAVNGLSRDLEAGRLDLAAAGRTLHRLSHRPPGYPASWRYLAQGLATAGFVLLLGGGGADLVPALLAGFLVRALDDRLSGSLPTFLSLFVSSLTVTVWAGVAGALAPGLSVDRLALAGILPLMPGLALTNAIRDLLAGDLLSGVARAADAGLQASAIAAGVLVATRAGQGWLV